MRILVTGGSSFVGAHFCRRVARDHEVLALHHTTALALNGVTPIKVDLRRKRDRRRLAEVRPDAVVHVACKIKGRPLYGETPSEAARNLNRQMMDAVLELGAPVLYASSTVVHWDQPSVYRDSRIEDEHRLMDSGLPYAIVRPSAPYGPKLANHRPRHKESFHTLAALVGKLPVVPVIGDGQYRRQPLHVDDFSAAMEALLVGGLPNRAFDAGGGESYTMDEIVAILAAAMGRHVRPLHLPKSLFVAMARFNKDFDAELLAASDEDEVADPTALAEATGVRFRTFEEGVRSMLAVM